MKWMSWRYTILLDWDRNRRDRWAYNPEDELPTSPSWL